MGHNGTTIKKIKRGLPKRKTGGVATYVYLRKTSGKPKRIRNGLQFEKNDSGVIYVQGRC